MESSSYASPTDAVAVSSRRRARPVPVGVWANLVELTKARLVGLVLVTAGTGFLMAPGAVDWLLLLVTMVGTALSALGANAYNQWMERELDARMERTRNRPLVAKSFSAARARLLSVGMMIVGPILLALAVNTITAVLAAAAALIYVLIYTPLKRYSTLCTLVGAVCGALPPMLGWTAATGSLGTGAWILGGILFVWQIPHFLALAWMYRDDYARGGFRMLPLVDPTGRQTCLVIILYTATLIPLGLAALMWGLAGIGFAIGSSLLGAGFLVLALKLQRMRTDANARRVFLASIIYLPLLLMLMIADRGTSGTVSAFTAPLTTVAASDNGQAS